MVAAALGSSASAYETLCQYRTPRSTGLIPGRNTAAKPETIKCIPGTTCTGSARILRLIPHLEPGKHADHVAVDQGLLLVECYRRDRSCNPTFSAPQTPVSSTANPRSESRKPPPLPARKEKRSAWSSTTVRAVPETPVLSGSKSKPPFPLKTPHHSPQPSSAQAALPVARCTSHVAHRCTLHGPAVYSPMPGSDLSPSAVSGSSPPCLATTSWRQGTGGWLVSVRAHMVVDMCEV
eukprot:1084261-Rhodomonas_salina.1